MENKYLYRIDMKTQKQKHLLCSLMCTCSLTSFLTVLMISCSILEKISDLASNKIFSILILSCFADAEKSWVNIEFSAIHDGFFCAFCYSGSSQNIFLAA